MKRSESETYIAYGKAFGQGNYRKSLGHLLDFISENQSEFTFLERGDMCMRIGEAYYFVGDSELALFFYRLGMDCNPTSLSAKLRFAKFIGRRLNDIDHAISLCSEIITSAEGNNKDQLAGNLERSQWYLTSANDLIDELVNQKEKP